MLKTVVIPCNMVDGYGCFTETYYLYLQGRSHDPDDRNSKFV